MSRQIHLSKRTTSAIWQAIRRCTVETDGAALVEFTLFASILLVMAIYAMDFGLYFSKWMAVQNAAQAGGQYVMVNGSCPAFTQINNYTISCSANYWCPSSSSPYLTSATQGSTCGASGPVAGQYAKVVAQTTYQTLAPYGLLSNSSYTLTATAWVRIQ